VKQLHLRIDKEIESDGGAPPTVFATIRALDPTSGRRRQEATPLREPIPISIDPTAVRSVPLAPGHYLVEVAMPSGEVLSDQITMTADRDANLVLQAEASPHEWLSWQHLMGNVGTKPPGLAPSLRPAKKAAVPKAPPPRKSARGTGSGRPSRGAKASFSGAPRRSARVAAPRAADIAAAAPAPAAAAPGTGLPPSIHWIAAPGAGLVAQAGVDPWATLDELARAEPASAERLSGAQPPRAIPVYTRDADRAVYRLVHGAGGASGATALGSTLPRDFIAVPDRGTVELLSLPTPWALISSGREAVVEIVVQRTAHVSDFASSITVRDDRLGVFLGYLSSGSLDAVREVAEDAQDLLFRKTVNPLAAVAGGYAMVGTATDDKKHEWHDWVNNLATWFQHIPDGAIQLAQLHLRLRRSSEDLDHAARWLKEAYRRGLPYYTLGIRWLLDGLEKLASRDSEADAMRRSVQAIAWRVHPQSAFTILHLGPR
jgi:hypothetical protein